MKSLKSVGKLPAVVPILPLRDMVIFPGVVIPLFLKGARVVKLAESLQGGSNLVGLFYQKARSLFGIWSDELSAIGTLARVERIVAVENGGLRAVAEGLCRIRLMSKVKKDPFLTADVALVEERQSDCEFHDTFVTCVTSQFKMAEAMGKTVNHQVLKCVEQSANIGQLADLVSTQISVNVESKQQLLETLDPVVRLRNSLGYLKIDIENFLCKPLVSTEPLAPNLAFKKPTEVDPQNRFKTFQKDFSVDEDPQVAELKSFQRKIRETGMPPDVAETVTREIQRLERIPPHSPEHVVSRTYIDVLTSLPWEKG
ncbi:MAG: LON peptidase substrate-binding domain-containing protein, partial [Desulfomonilaceae bacterium]